jgi:hypothetical protein
MLTAQTVMTTMIRSAPIMKILMFASPSALVSSATGRERV